MGAGDRLGAVVAGKVVAVDVRGVGVVEVSGSQGGFLDPAALEDLGLRDLRIKSEQRSAGQAIDQSVGLAVAQHAPAAPDVGVAQVGLDHLLHRPGDGVVAEQFSGIGHPPQRPGPVDRHGVDHLGTWNHYLAVHYLGGGDVPREQLGLGRDRVRVQRAMDGAAAVDHAAGVGQVGHALVGHDVPVGLVCTGDRIEEGERPAQLTIGRDRACCHEVASRDQVPGPVLARFGEREQLVRILAPVPSAVVPGSKERRARVRAHHGHPLMGNDRIGLGGPIELGDLPGSRVHSGHHTRTEVPTQVDLPVTTSGQGHDGHR